MASSSAKSGLLYVTMQPKPGLPEAEFHDWYNNEHGPTRLRLPFIINGFRYQARDVGPRTGTSEVGSQSKPEWMALYDITDMDELTRQTYTRLREDGVKSQREKDTMSQIWVDRKLLDLVGEKTNPETFLKLEDIENTDAGNLLISISTITNDEGKKKLDQWYEESLIASLEQVVGFRRTRRYVTSRIEPRKDGKIEYLALHEFALKNEIKGRLLQFTEGIPVQSEVDKARTYGLYYTFGPAPRHLSEVTSWTSPDEKTKILPGSESAAPAIESFITTADGCELPFRLGGSSNPNAPLIVLCNSILVDYTIWDGFIASFFSNVKNHQCRILRYNSRGRSGYIGSPKGRITVDLLAADIITLLDALKVPKAAAVVGVSLGGATALNVALKYPKRIEKFVSCDTNSVAPPSNPKAWGERIEMAEKEGAKVTGTGEAIVGNDLAEATVRRWFVKESYDGGAMEKEVLRVKGLVAANNLEGFTSSVQALYEYDFRDEMARYSGKGAFLVGSGDGALPKMMEEMAKGLGQHGTLLRVVDGAGHLPMVEKPEKVAAFVTEVLEK